MLKVNQNQKSDKALFITYEDLESLIEKIDGSKNNPEDSSKTKVDENIPPDFSMSIVFSFTIIENKHNVQRSKDCMKKLCEPLREHAVEIINFKKKKMEPLRNKQQKSYENTKNCYVCKDKFEDKHAKDKNFCKNEDHCYYTGEYRGAARSIYNLKYIVLKEIPVVFHNGANYDYHFIIKELPEEFEN